MTTNQVGNEQNMDKIRELRQQKELEDKVNLGSQLKEGVYIDYTTVFGTHVEGNVIFKRPSMKDYMTMGALKSEYLRQAGVRDINLVDNTIKFMAQVMSTLKVVIVKSPEWLLDIDSIKEMDILYHVFGKYEEWEESFRKTIPTAQEGNSQPSESEETVVPS